MEENKKYDVGIFGLWYGNNYGSIITYYALSKVIESMGLSCAMIRNPLGREINIDELERSHPLRFAKEKYTVTPLYNLNDMYKLNEWFDTFVIGSDQMWNYGLSKPYRQSYFLEFVDERKNKVSYATSFGQNKYNGPYEEKVITRKNLQRFNFISVREDFSKRICEEEFGVNAKLVLDPVFLCPTDEYEKLIDEAEGFSVDGDYIFAYILDPNPAIGRGISQISEETGKKVIVAFNQTGNMEELQNRLEINSDKIEFRFDITVKEWLYLFKNSVYVLTDSFHGTCFSILFRKNFISLKNARRGGSRFNFLLKKFGLLNLMIETPEQFTEKFHDLGINYHVNYEKVFEIIDNEKRESMEWFKNALNGTTRLVPYKGIKSFNSKVAEEYNVCPKIKCTGCSACANICPQRIIKMKADSEGFLYPTIDEKDKCTQCGLCTRTCPVLNPSEKIKSNKEPIATYAAYSLDEETRFMSTSGGAFSEFAKYVLSEGGVCYGAAYDDDFTVRHIRITDLEGLEKIRQSKYYQCAMGDDVYRNVKKDLSDNKLVLFCGSPCQTAGLSGYLNRDYDNLIIVDFICHSVSSEKAFKAYLSELEEKFGEKATRIWFKNKEKGWHRFSQRIDFGEKSYFKPWTEDDYMKGFLNFKVFQRPSCHNCSFKGFKRSADVTLADFWGLKWNNPEVTDDQEKGVSVIMLHTDKIKKIFDEHIRKNMYCEEHDFKEIPPKNGGLYLSQKVGEYRDYFFENLGKAPFSEIIASMAKNDREIKAAAPSSAPQHHEGGKLTKIGNVVLNIDPTAKLIINGELICNSKLPEGSAKECVLILHKNSTLIVNGTFRIGYDSVVQIFPGGVLTLNGGSFNAGTVIAVKRNTVFGNDFLGGRHLVVQDSDFHQVIDLDSDQPINISKDGIKISEHVWCGEGVTILKDVHIGKNVVIGAKSVVTKDIESNTAVAGSPARVIRRNITWKL